ncbi:MAG: hypothetical protein V1871_06875 [Planctomycetota bacterium]
MRRDYIPESDAEFNEWLAGFTAYIAAHYAELGLSATDKDNIVAANNDWKRDFSAHITAKNAARGAKGGKNNTRKMAESLARNLAQRSTVYPGTTNAHRASMGITVPDTNPTQTAPEYVASLDPPLLLLDWSGRGQVVIHFGVNPGNEKENAKPMDIAGVKIWYRIKTGLPAEASAQAGSWTFVADDTNSPYVHNLAAVQRTVQAGLAITEPISVEYKAQWFDKKMRTGAFSQTAKCTVSP